MKPGTNGLPEGPEPNEEQKGLAFRQGRNGRARRTAEKRKENHGQSFLPDYHIARNLGRLKRRSLSLQQLCFDGLSARLLSLTGVVLEQVVHLLKSPSARLRNEEERPDERQKTEHGEEDVCTVAGVLDQGRGDETLFARQHFELCL